MDQVPVVLPSLATTREAADLMGVTTVTVRRWVLAGVFPDRPGGRPGWVRTPGGHLRFYREAIEAFLLDRGMAE